MNTAIVQIKHLGKTESFFVDTLRNQENGRFRRKLPLSLNECVKKNKHLQIITQDIIKQQYNNNNPVEIEISITYEEEETNIPLCTT